MWTPGLVSVSFRGESPETILHEARAAGLRAIEWGGDVHVPPGDLENARRIGAATREAGLSVAAYGSYYRLGTAEDPAAAFSPVPAPITGGRPGSWPPAPCMCTYSTGMPPGGTLWLRAGRNDGSIWIS